MVDDEDANVYRDEDHQSSAGRSIQENGGDGSGSGFDPTPYMRQLRGRGGAQEYLDVKWRLLWLRRDHPNAEILTEHINIDESSAIFKATVSIPSGGRATGYGSETAGDFGDFIEKAETKAIGRALNALGYGAQFAEGEEESLPPADFRATARSQPDDASTASMPAPTPIPSSPRPDPVPPTAPNQIETEPPSSQGTAPEDIASGDRDQSSAGTAEPPSSPPVEPEPEMADYSHSAFWDWARPRGYQTRDDVEQAIGRSMKGMTPKEVRRALREHGAAE